MASNQNVNKVVYAGTTLIDLTSDDVTAGDVLSGKKFHLPSGAQGTGSCTYDADTSDATATAAEILSTKTAYKNGSKLTGTMPNNGAVSKTLDATANNQSYTVPAGYHSGSGEVQIVLEEKSATPTTSSQTISPTSGKVLSEVTVNAIPVKYVDTTGDNARPANLLEGAKAHTNAFGRAVQITGTMANNGAIAGSIDGLTTTSYSVAAGYTSGGTVSLTSDIEDALSAI